LTVFWVKRMEKQVQSIVEMMDLVLGDPSVPRNVKRAVTDAKQKLMEPDELTVRLTSAVYALDEVSNDINIPMHARTLIWNLLSALETAKER